MLLLTLLLGATAVLGAVDYSGHKVLRATPSTDHHLTWLTNLKDVDFWKDPTSVNRPVDFRVSPDRVKTLQMSMTYLRMHHEVLHEDVQVLIDNAMSHTVDKSDLSDFDDYKNITSIEAYLTKTVAACGARCSIDTHSEASFEDRDLWVVRITDGLGGTKRNVWVDAGIHAREWLAHSTGLFFIDRLVHDFGVDAEVDDILSTHDVYIMPVINADGYVYTWTDDRMWRKSRQPYGGCIGTDINRNFDFMWMTIGASDDPCSNTYAGPEAWSEPEAKVVRDVVQAMYGTLDVFMTMHTYGQLWMAPFGYTTEPPAGYDELMRVADAGADALTAVYGTPYERGSASEILYASSGTSRDWGRGDATTLTEIPYVYTLELRNTNSFILPASEILPTGEETWAGFKAMMLAIKNP